MTVESLGHNLGQDFYVGQLPNGKCSEPIIFQLKYPLTARKRRFERRREHQVLMADCESVRQRCRPTAIASSMARLAFRRFDVWRISSMDAPFSFTLAAHAFERMTNPCS